MTAKQTLVLGGALSVAIGLITFLYPPAVADTVWGHPFPHGVHVAISAGLVVCHLLKAHGFAAGLSRLAGGVTRWSMWLAALGFVVLAICEGISATLGGVAMDAPPAVQLNNGYGVGSMLSAVPSVVGGAVIAHRRLLPGPARWSVLLSGAFMIFVVTPALILGRGPAAYLALTGWSVFFVWIGLALGRTEDSQELGEG